MKRRTITLLAASFMLCQSVLVAQSAEPRETVKAKIPLRLYFTAPQLVSGRIPMPSDLPAPFLPQHSKKFKSFQKYGMHGLIIGVTGGFALGVLEAMSRDYSDAGLAGPVMPVALIGAYTVGGMIIGAVTGIVAYIIFESWKGESEFEESL
jgi:hypothetical protein